MRAIQFLLPAGDSNWMARMKRAMTNEFKARGIL